MIYRLHGSNVVPDYFIAIFGAGKFLEIFPETPSGDSSPD